MNPLVINNNNIKINFHFGYNLMTNLPSTIGDNKIQVILKENGIVQDHLFVGSSTSIIGNVKYYVEWDAEAYTHVDGEMKLVWEQKFSLKQKDVIFDLFPREKRDLDVWLEYLKYFQQHTECNLYLWNTNEWLQEQNYFPVIDNANGIPYFAIYRVCWDNDKYVNPFGVNLNPYDLINGCLLRIDI